MRRVLPPGLPQYPDGPSRSPRFYRVDEGRSQDAGGAGLGLAIAKWAVQANGGEIHVKPAAACGSSFLIRMPCQIVSSPSATQD
jgi:signal transduction histidine kinase